MCTSAETSSVPTTSSVTAENRSSGEPPVNEEPAKKFPPLHYGQESAEVQANALAKANKR